jgi:predicted MFS family arabinose efflux permease
MNLPLPTSSLVASPTRETGMSATSTAVPHDAGSSSLLNPALVRVLVADFGALTGFFLLLSVLPGYVVAHGASSGGAGLTTAALMAATVAAELVIPRIVTRCGYRATLAVGLVLLGAPALVLPALTDLTAVVAVCAVRGLGFAVTVVVCGALVATLVPEGRRGEGLGVLGLVAGAPAVIALPAGIWLVGVLGHPAVFVLAALTALLPILGLRGLPEPAPADAAAPAAGMAGALRTPELTRPTVVFTTTAVAAGVAVTFLPLAVPGWSGRLAALALLVHAATATAARWWAGRYGDRHGPTRLVVPGMAVTAAGLLVLAIGPEPAAVLVGAAVFGAGFGVVQSATMAVLLARVQPSGYGVVSALWNLGYDAGYGIGAAGFGALVGATGFQAGWAILAVLVLAGLALARRGCSCRSAR